MAFQKAVKSQARLRLALIGPAGSGKTYTALRIATGLGGRIALIDTERGSASHYANRFDFDKCELGNFGPDDYTAAIHEAEAAGYDIIIIDSLTHAWSGTGGALELVDKERTRGQGGNSFTAWKTVTPKHNAMVDAILQSSCHVLVTMRTKTEYVVEQNEKGKSVPRKIGLAPVQRDGLEYEFDVICDLTIDNDCIVGKTRCDTLQGKVFKQAGEHDIVPLLKAWLSDGVEHTKPVEVIDKIEAPKTNGHITKAPASKQLLDRWSALWQKAQELGIEETPLPMNASAEVVIERGKALREEIAKREDDLVVTKAKDELAAIDAEMTSL